MPTVERRGRKPHTELRINRSARVRESLTKEVDELLRDPLLNKTKHGAYSNLINHLLADWVSKQRIAQK